MFDKLIIHSINPAGWPVDFEISAEPGKLDQAIAFLEGKGFSPAPTAQDAKAIQMSPEGLPICPKHGEVMRERNKQNQTWFSHKVTAPDGQEHYCKGRRGKDSPGWNIEPE